jgi:hypothetical protein
MAVRISHCSDSLENYYLCIKEKVAGFTNRGPQSGDLIYLVVKVGKKSFCGAKYILDEPTDYKPWPDADNYVNALTIKEVEYCEPFDISILSETGGKHWALKYVQGSKSITDNSAIELLNSTFNKNKTDHLVEFEEVAEKPKAQQLVTNPVLVDDDLTVVEDEKELAKVIKEIPDIKVNIMGTFQTIHFSNESDKIKGLETLVNENFYSLFPQFPETKTLLIPENRLFKTKGFKVDGNNVSGIRTIPDALLIVFDQKQKNPFQINLIEYECYGERKTRETDKSNYLNSNVIPQLMRFASAFSIITDDQTRFNTVKEWVDKIIDYLNKEESQSNKMIGWIKEMFPDIKERSIEREIEKQLMEAFKTNLRVLLIIDELSSEQKSTIKNVVSSFKLANGENNVQFSGYVVRLVQKINIINHQSEFALTVQ